MSKISFCNKTVVRKDITRFFPLWLSYLVVVLLYFPATLPVRSPVEQAGWLLSRTETFCIAYLAYGFLAAVFLFGGLFRSRSAYMLHAFPIRRETWFGSHVLSGLLFSLVPNFIAGLACLLISSMPIGAVGLWFLVLTLGYLFAFSVTAVAISCTGNFIGTGLMAALLLFGLPGGESLLRRMLTPLFYGLPSFDGPWSALISPAFWFFNGTLVSCGGYWDAPPSASFADCVSVSWLHIGILLAVCLGLLTLALLLYRKRPAEAAGDLLAFSPIKKVFPYVFGLYFSLILSSILLDCLYPQHSSNIWQRNYAPVLLCLVGTALVGFFAGSMLLHKNFRVFRLRNFLGCAALAAVLGVCVLCCRFDWFGRTHIIPKEEQVASVQLSIGYYRENIPAITDEQGIAEVLALHQILIQEQNELQNRNEGRYEWKPEVNAIYDYTYAVEKTGKEAYTEDYSAINICYTLKNGKTLMRRYWLYSAVNLPLPQNLGLRLNSLLNTMEYQEYRLFGFPYLHLQEDPWGYLAENVYYISATGFDPVEYVSVGESQALSLECLPELLEALRADMAEGNLEDAYDRSFVPDGEIYDVTVCNLVLEYETPNETDNSSVSLRVTEQAAHTLACLEVWGFIFP